jgi:hypothetical protein
VTPRREILGEDKELAFRLLQNAERSQRGPVDAKLNAVKIVRRVGKDRDKARTGPVERDAARGFGAVPCRNVFLVESPVPAVVFDWIESKYPPAEPGAL